MNLNIFHLKIISFIMNYLFIHFAHSHSAFGFLLWLPILLGPPRWCKSNKSAYQCSSCKRCKFNPWVWKIPLSRKCQPIPVFLPGKFHGQRSLADPLHRVTKSWTWLSMHTHIFSKITWLWCKVKFVGGHWWKQGHGCFNNPNDRWCKVVTIQVVSNGQIHVNWRQFPNRLG